MVIIRIDADRLRKIADQLDAHKALKEAGATHVPSGTAIAVDGDPVAYLSWWEDAGMYLAEFTEVTPRGATPLLWHKESC